MKRESNREDDGIDLSDSSGGAQGSSTVSREDRYSVERVKERHWVVVDTTRQGQRVGWSVDEDGARRIVSLLNSLRRGPGRVAG